MLKALKIVILIYARILKKKEEEKYFVHDVL